MNNEEVDRLMARAHDSLVDAQVLFDAKRYNGVPNRSYYAIFDAVNALLRLHDLYTKTHKGAKSKFNELFVKTEQMPVEANDWLEESFELRQSGDYDFTYDVSDADATHSIELARNFLLHTEAYLREQNFIN